MNYIKYSIDYNKKEKQYYINKTLYKNNIPVAFKGIYNGSKHECNKYCNENNIKLKEKIVLPS